MLGASKILTVSYGTFSCTLEGFDEPFSTMKAIAEYFRDLAAEDRYFGAEPPTPDAAMLHRIAEREIQRRVEAKVQENGVILRAGDEGSALTAPAPVAAAPRLDAAPAPAETAADKLRRLRSEAAERAMPAPLAIEAEEEPVAAALPFAPPVAEYEEDEPVDPPAFVAEAPEPVGFDADFGYDGDLDLDAPLTALAEEPVAALPVAEGTEEFAEDLPEDAASESAEEDFLTDSADEGDEVMLAALAALDAPAAAAPVADDLTDADDWDEGFEEEEDDTAAMLAALVEDTADAPAPAQAAAPQAPAAGFALAEISAPEGLDLDDDLALADVADDSFAEEEVEASTGTESLDAAELVAPAVEAAPAPAPVSDKAQRARARVIRIRRSDAPAATPAPVAEAMREPVAETPAEAAAEIPAPRASLLSPEAEAALQAELAALEAEIGGFEPEAATPQAVAEPEAEPVAEAEPRRRVESRLEDGTDDSVSRLIARTDTEMDGEDTRRRRSAIEHLKAAVAATTAERQMQGSSPERGETRKDAYRADLEQAVRPQRPEGERLSPLVLVSEQRIDRPRPATSAAALSVAANAAEAPAAPSAAPGPVRPRRVKAGRHAAAAQSVAELAAEDEPQAEATPPRPQVVASQPQTETDGFDLDEDDEDEGNVFSDSKSFGDFAERLGATQLPDLIEAAAVYCAMILKRPEFSRPLVLRQVSELPASAGLAREDCLRSFGHLMRKGRITKVRAGHFAVTERSPLLAEALRNAG